MSQSVNVELYIDDGIRCVGDIEDKLDEAEDRLLDVKMQLYGLVMASPKHMFEDLSELRQEFDRVWGDLMEAAADNYRYSVVCDDVKYCDNPIIGKWKQMAEDEENAKREWQEKKRVFSILGLNEYNIKHLDVYRYMKKNASSTLDEYINSGHILTKDEIEQYSKLYDDECQRLINESLKKVEAKTNEQ